MKNKQILILIVILVIFIFPLNTFVQDSPQWHLPEGAKARLGKGSISEIAYSPDGARLAVASGIGIWIYDAATGEALDLLTRYKSHINNVSFSPDGRTLASGSWKEISLWDVATGRHLRTLRGHTSLVDSVSFSPDGRTLASGSWDRTIRLWDVATGVRLRALRGHADVVRSVSFSPDGRTLASGGEDNTIRLTLSNIKKSISGFEEGWKHRKVGRNTVSTIFHPSTLPTFQPAWGCKT